MAINVSQAFHRTSANPVDESMALTKAQMLTVNDNLMPAYYFTICQDDGEIYLYNKTTIPSATTGKFTKFEGGGGGGGGTEGIVITKTLLASGWNSITKQQTLTFTGYNVDMGGVIGMPTNATSAQKQAYTEALIDVTSQDGNIFTFQCEEIPSIDLPVTLYAGGSGGGGGANLPSGGATGQALVKHSNADQDVEWATINSIPNGGTIGQALVKASSTDKDVEWGTVKKTIEDNGTAVTDRNTVNLTDFDVEDDNTNKKTNVSAHRLTASEMVDIMSTLPGAPTQYPKYSTTEQVVGEWIDGKPLYQKTVIMTMPTLSTKYAITPISDCDILFVVWAFEHSSNTTMNMYPAYGNDAKLHGSVWATDSHHADGGRIILQADDNIWAGVTIYVTVQYTKITD